MAEMRVGDKENTLHAAVPEFRLSKVGNSPGDTGVRISYSLQKENLLDECPLAPDAHLGADMDQQQPDRLTSYFQQPCAKVHRSLSKLP
ncbi:MAG: hypothetical protein NVSMB6_08820 [Burkholderiaceae bacterium]